MKSKKTESHTINSDSTLAQMLDVHPDDVSKNLFIMALRRATAANGGVLWDLARRVKVHGRSMENWAKGRCPPYIRMQEFYRVFLEIAKEVKK